LEAHYGREEVDRYWAAMFRPGAGIPLLDFVKKEGVRGCFTYWSGTLNEEAADFTMYLNEKRGFYKLVMHRCPSKGRLLDLQTQIGLTPFRDYCLHCDSYRAACKEAGLEYIYDFQNTDKAGCSIFIYDPKVFDGRIILDEDTEIMERRASDNEYFHPHFHFSLSRGMHYVGTTHGEDAVLGILTQYVQNVIRPLMGTVNLASIEEKILEDYQKEHCPAAVSTKRTDQELEVTVHYCPAIRFMQEHDMWQSPWFRYTTEGVMTELAKFANATFHMDRYDEETGAAAYRFISN
jgi:hypothetical protein